MVKGVLTAIAVVAGTVGMVGLSQTSTAGAVKQEVTICHRTDAVKNPYVVLKVDADSVDGDAGNDNGQGDHYKEHNGPVASSEAVAQAYKDAKVEWGDIIPPVAGVHNGYNWTVEGQAIYNNGCNYVTNQGQANVSASLVCKESTKTFTMTLTNSGTKSASIELNGETFTLAANSSTTRDFVDNGNGVSLKLTVDGKVDGTYDGTRPFYCKQGGGSTTTTTTTTGQGQGGAAGVESLPVTGNVKGVVASAIAIVTATAAAAGSHFLRSRSAEL